jgi:hypothetical protein
MVMALAHKENVRMNANTFELVIEALLEHPNQHQEIVSIIQLMDRHSYQLALDTCVACIQYLESQRHYRLALWMYQYMIHHGYEFYENKLLNEIFVKLIKLVGVGNNLNRADKGVWKEGGDFITP